MIETFITITPVLILFCIGVFSRKLKILDENVSTKLLRFLFYFIIPSLILSNYKTYTFNSANLAFPLFSIIHISTLTSVSFALSYLLKLDQKTKGSFILSTTILNIGFLLPLVMLDMGSEKVITLIMFDMGNALLVFTVFYAIAAYFGTGKSFSASLILKILTVPPFWALVIAILLNKTGITIPEQLDKTLNILGKMTIPLTFIILGAKFSFKIYKLRLMLTAIFIKVALGFFLALVLAKLFGFNETNTQLALLIGATPSGYNAIVFSDLEKLDTKLAVNTVSISILVCVILYPLIKVVAKLLSG